MGHRQQELTLLFAGAHQISAHGVDGFGQLDELGILARPDGDGGVQVAGGDPARGRYCRHQGPTEASGQGGGHHGGHGQADDAYQEEVPDSVGRVVDLAGDDQDGHVAGHPVYRGGDGRVGQQGGGVPDGLSTLLEAGDVEVGHGDPRRQGGTGGRTVGAESQHVDAGQIGRVGDEIGVPFEGGLGPETGGRQGGRNGFGLAGQLLGTGADGGVPDEDGAADGGHHHRGRHQDEDGDGQAAFHPSR